ncbi:MAG: hypothetical protein QFE16_12340 [Pseudomonadota bacterium]|nr:hypothetical protein [Pseudomonadota bacterium]
MKLNPLVLAAFAFLNASAVLAADAPVTTATPILGMVRLLKADGSTVVSQAIVTPGLMQQIGVRGVDAIASANGRCAFNLKIDEVSRVALTATTTRLFSNDTLVANVTKLDLVANTVKSFVTQPYLYAGRNNVKLVFNAESTTPTIGWVQVLVDGTCGAAPAPVATPKPTPPAPPSPPVKPGSADWNQLFNAYGWSNYAVHGLQGKGYIRYDELVSVNAALTVAVKAGTIERAAFLALMVRWNAINTDADFKAAMAKVVPGSDRRI